MGRTLDEITLLELLPESIRSDPQMAAAAAALEAELQAVNALAGSVAVYAAIDTATEPILSTLAWQLHVDHLEGWALAETDAQKRALVRTALEAHRHKGSRWALERVFSLLDMTGRVVPWYAEDGEPYTFRLDVTVPDRGITEDFLATIEGLVGELKNVRSHLAGITLATASKGRVYVGGVTLAGDTAQVLPYAPPPQETTGRVYVAAGMAVYDIATVRPQEV